MHEQDDFQPRSTTREGLPDSNTDSRTDSGLLLHEDGGLLQVQLVVTPFGMPRRWRRPPAVHLANGQWLRWQVNYRFASTSGEWTYRLDTLNIAHGRASTTLFVGTPTRYVSELATLR